MAVDQTENIERWICQPISSTIRKGMTPVDLDTTYPPTDLIFPAYAPRCP